MYIPIGASSPLYVPFQLEKLSLPSYTFSPHLLNILKEVI